MKPIQLLLFLTSCLFLSCNKDHSTTIKKFEFASPEEVGMHADTLRKIEPMVMEFVNSKKYPGAVTLIAKDGKIIYESEVGWSDSLRSVPYRKNHLFRMASMTKPVVSVAAMQLVEQGKLRLDDPIKKYIPSFDGIQVLKDFNPADTTWTGVPANSDPTVRQLLTHTAGVPYGFVNPQVSGAILTKNGIPDLTTYLDKTIEETMSRIGELPLMHQPGEKWMYGLNTDVLGRVVEVASGMDLDDYVRENITNPLGAETFDFFFNSSEAKDNLTKVYVTDSLGRFMYMEKQAPFYIADYPVEGAKSYFSGGSGMTGTARDYFLFCQAMLDDGILGNTMLLKEETAKMMHQNQLDTITFPSPVADFGFGFDIAKEDHPTRPKGTYSWSGAFSTTFWIDPVNDIIVIQLRQVLSSPFNQEINSRLEKLVYNALMD